MSRGGATSKTAPTAWVYLPSGNCTIRWQRGDNVVYVFEGKQLDAYPDEPLSVEVLATIRLSSQGWTDLAQVRLLGERWVKEKRRRCESCGVHS